MTRHFVSWVAGLAVLTTVFGFASQPPHATITSEQGAKLEAHVGQLELQVKKLEVRVAACEKWITHVQSGAKALLDERRRRETTAKPASN